MPNQSAVNDPNEIWRSQPTEPSDMKLGTLVLRQKARELRSKSRSELFRTIAAGVFLTGIFLYGAMWSDVRLAQIIFAAAGAWALAGQYFLHRGMWQAPPPGDAGLHTGLDFCRAELERQLHLHSNILGWLIGPLVPGLAAFLWTIAGKGSASKMAPFLGLLMVWTLSLVVIRVRQGRDLQRGIEELDELERASRP